MNRSLATWDRTIPLPQARVLPANSSHSRNVILVTGASGFVGHPLAGALARLAPVRAVVRTPDVPDRDGIETVPVGDYTLVRDWLPILSGASVVVHLAARTHVLNDQSENPEAAYRAINVDVTRKLMEAAARARVNRVVLMSSVKAAGESSGLTPLKESMAAAPLDAYGRTKLEAEALAAEIARAAGIDLIVLRPPMVYGPRVRGNFLRLLKLVDRGVPLPLASVRNRRSLISIDNLIHAVCHAVRHPARAAATYFVADPESTSVPDLIREMGRALEKPARMLPFPPALLMAAARLAGRADEARRLIGTLEVDITSIRERLGWIPPHTLSEGLKATAGWYHPARSHISRS